MALTLVLTACTYSQAGWDQHAAIRTTTERSVTTWRKDSLSLSRVGQHAAIRIATECSATTRRKRTHDVAARPAALVRNLRQVRHQLHIDLPPEPGGSACCYWNGYGSNATTRLKQPTAWMIVDASLRFALIVAFFSAAAAMSSETTCPPSRVDQHVAIGTATEAMQPPGSNS